MLAIAGVVLTLAACGDAGTPTPAAVPLAGAVAPPQTAAAIQATATALSPPATPAPAPARPAPTAAPTAAPTPLLPLPGATRAPAPPATAGLTLTPSTPPSVQVRTEFYTDTYRLRANSCQTAGDFMHTHGPGGWPAETRLTFEVDLPPVPLSFTAGGPGETCAAAGIDVRQTILTFTLRITLPDWDALGQTGCLGAAREWQMVHDALVVHEHGHADRYQARYPEWAAKVGGRLAGEHIAACGADAAAATAAAQQQIDALLAAISGQLQGEIADDPEQNRYEQETQHGITQGAVFHADGCRCAP